MILAELCQNHLGDKNRLSKMVDAVAQAGVWGAKIQTFFAKDLGQAWAHDRERLLGLELDWETHHEFVRQCERLKIVPVTTVYSFDYAQELWNAGFRHVKIGSAQATQEGLIKRYIVAGFQVLLSTGGHFLDQIPKLHPLHTVFHCVSTYPLPDHEADLTRLFEVRKRYPGARVGFSDHSSPGSIVSKMAIFLGAEVIERHFILDREVPTKDSSVSITAPEMKDLCRFATLTLKEQLKLFPSWGLMRCPKKATEMETIGRYANRFKLDGEDRRPPDHAPH